MTQEKYDIFISYRRKDENGKEWGTSFAHNILQALEDRGYKGRVFFDHNKIGPEDFEKKILGAIKQAKVFLCILTRNSMDNCVYEGDWVRREICQAMESGLKIIFLNPDNEFNHNLLPNNFPEELEIVKKQNSLEVRSGQKFEVDIDDIVKNHISTIVPLSIKPSSKQLSVSPMGTLRVDTDLDCRVFNYGKEVGIAKAGVYTTFELPLGDNDLIFVGLESNKDRYSEMVTILENHQKLVRVRLLDKYNERKAKEEAERKAREDAERMRARIEAEKRKLIEKVIIPSTPTPIPQVNKTTPQTSYKSNPTWIENIKKRWKNICSRTNWEEVISWSALIIIGIGACIQGYFGYQKNRLLNVFESDGMYGYEHGPGKIVIPAKYSFAESFRDGIARVELNDKWGFIDKKDQEIIPLKYDTAGFFIYDLAAVKLNGKWGFIDKTGKEVIPLKYDWAESFSEGLARVYLNGKWGFIDKTGKEIIPLKYDNARDFVMDKARVKLNGEEFYIDKNGNRVEE